MSNVTELKKPNPTMKDLLDAKIPRDAISQRDGGGPKKLSYLEGWYVIARLNEVLGQGNWHYNTVEMKLVHAGEIEGKYGPVHTCHYIAHVALTAYIDNKAVQFSDYGYGDGTDKVNPGKAHELAVKEAVTDGIKRCAKNLGMSMGLALYDKTQENVSDEEPAAAPKSTARPAGTRSGGQATEAKPPVAKESPASNGQVPSIPPTDRDQTNQIISRMSSVAIAQKKTDLASLRAEMMTRYKTDKKEELTATQAADLYAYLRGMIYGES